MNLPLYIGLLVLYGVCTHPMNTSIRHHIVKRVSTPADIAEVNRLRQEIARVAGISMPDLVWDEELARIAASLKEPNCDYTNAYNYRFIPDDPDENAAKFIAFIATMIGVAAGAQANFDKLNSQQREALQAFANQLDSQINTPKFTLFHFEVLNPAQTKMGCAPNQCSEPLPPMDQQTREFFGLTGQNVGFGSLCLIGPSNRWDPATFKQVGITQSSTNTFSMDTAVTLLLISVVYSFF